jgi:recombinational DNA repair protein RecT
MEQNILHRYPLSARGKAIGVYAIAIDQDGNKTMKYMSMEEVMEFKKFSKSKDSQLSPWNPANDPEGNMLRKTVIKQISKNFPLTEEIYSAISEDNKESSVEDYQKSSLLEQSRRPTEHSVESLLQIPPKVEEKEEKIAQEKQEEIVPESPQEDLQK